MEKKKGSDHFRDILNPYGEKSNYGKIGRRRRLSKLNDFFFHNSVGDHTYHCISVPVLSLTIFFSSLAGKPNCHMHDSQPTSVNSQLSTFNHEGKQLKNIGTYIHTRIHPAALKSVHSSSRIWHQRMHERSWSIFSTHANSSLSLIPKSIAPKQKMVVKLWCPSEKTRTGWFQYHLHPYTLT